MRIHKTPKLMRTFVDAQFKGGKGDVPKLETRRTSKVTQIGTFEETLSERKVRERRERQGQDASTGSVNARIVIAKVDLKLRRHQRLRPDSR